MEQADVGSRGVAVSDGSSTSAVPSALNAAATVAPNTVRREEALAAARTAERTNTEAMLRIAGSGIRSKCTLDDAADGRCAP